MKKLLFFWLYSFWLTFSFGQCLSGSYTIGGVSPDYGTIDSAVADLIANGVCDSVFFLIRNGTYTEQIVIPQINGASDTTRITFRSEANDPALLNWEFPSSALSSDNYVLKLDGVDFISFEAITFERTGTLQYEQVVEISGGAHNNEFINSVFIADVINGSSSDALIFSPATLDTNNHFTSNTFTGGTFAFNYSGTLSTKETGTKITSNTFTDQNYGGLQMYKQEAIEVIGNEITSISNYDYFVCILLDSCLGAYRVLKNHILRPPFNGIRGSGIEIIRCVSDSLNPGLIANNMINLRGAGNILSSGIYTQDASSVDLVFNTIYVYVGSQCMRLNGGSNLNILNNNLRAGAKVLDVNSTTSVDQCDYNNYYVTGFNADIAYWNGDRETLTDLIIASGKSVNCVTVDPLFVSTFDLHLNANIDIDGAAIPYVGILDDYDGDLRNVSTPDIGADEFDLPNNDAGIVSFDGPLGNPCPGSSDVYVSFRNYGWDTLTSVFVTWSVNSVPQTPFLWTGLVLPGDTSSSVNIGSYNFLAGGMYSIDFSDSLPNGFVDANSGNNALSVSSIPVRLIGNFTIGGSTPDYPSYTDAVNDLILRGICSPIVFNVRTGTYTEQIDIPQIIGSSFTNTITIQSEILDSAAVTLTTDYFNTTANNYTLQISGADYLTIRHMTIQRRFNGMNGLTALSIGFGCSNLCITNNRFLGGTDFGNVNAQHGTVVDVFNGAGNDSMIIDNNLIKGGLSGISILGGNAKNLVFSNNEIVGTRANSVYIEFVEGLVISNNIIINDSSYGQARRGLQIETCTGQLVVSRNIVITNARIDQLYKYGVRIYLCDVDAATSEVSNNFIQLKGNPADTLDFNYALSLLGTDSLRIYNNTITSNHVDSINGAAFAAESSYGIELKNNIFFNNGRGRACFLQWVTVDSDYNSFYASGDLLVNLDSNILEWQSSGLDSNSVETNPQFISTNDLHIAGDTILAHAGTPLASILIDIDEDSRDPTNPDIGADEFSSFLDVAAIDLSASVTPCTNDSVTVSIMNYGIDSLNSVTIFWEVDGNTQTPYIWTGNLGIGQVDSNLALGSYPFTVGSTYLIRAWTSQPNGAGDPNNNNDTVQVTLNMTVSLDLGADTFYVCFGDSIVLSADTGFTSYLWNDGSTGQTLTADSSGVYSVDIVNSQGCPKSDSTYVEVGTAISLTVSSSNVVCNGGNTGGATVTASGGFPGYTYVWSSGGNTTSEVALIAATYAITVSDQNTCSVIDTFTITEPLPIVISGEATTNIGGCNGDSTGSITITAAGGTGNLTYSINAGASFTNNAGLFTGLPSGSYPIVVQDSMGCSSPGSTLVLNEPSSLTITLDAYAQSCYLDSTGAMASLASGGTAPYFYSWSTGGITDSLSGLSAGSYSLTITDTSGCNVADSANISDFAQIIIILPKSDVSCFGGGDGYATTVISGGTGPYAYNWSNGGLTDTIFNLQPGSYSLEVTDVFGCSGSDSVAIGEPPFITGSQIIGICDGDSIFLEGAYQFNSGIYSDTLTAVNGCDSANSTTLTVNALPTVTFSGLDTGYCTTNAIAQLTGSPSGGMFSGTGIIGSQFDPASTGIGTFQISYSYTDVNNCTNDETKSTNVAICTGILDEELTLNLKIYPNPSSGTFLISLTSKYVENVELKVLNGLGQAIYYERVNQLNGSAIYIINLQNQAAGIYNLHIGINQRVLIRQLIVK